MEIELAIESLTPRELDDLYSWLDQHGPQPIDLRMEFDVAAGRFDNAIREAREAEESAQVGPL